MTTTTTTTTSSSSSALSAQKKQRRCRRRQSLESRFTNEEKIGEKRKEGRESPAGRAGTASNRQRPFFLSGGGGEKRRRQAENRCGGTGGREAGREGGRPHTVCLKLAQVQSGVKVIIPACLNFRGLAPASLSNQPQGTGLTAERRWIISKFVPKRIYSLGLHGAQRAWGNAIIVTNRSLITPGTDCRGFRGRFGNKQTVIASGAIVDYRRLASAHGDLGLGTQRGSSTHPHRRPPHSPPRPGGTGVHVPHLHGPCGRREVRHRIGLPQEVRHEIGPPQEVRNIRGDRRCLGGDRRQIRHDRHFGGDRQCRATRGRGHQQFGCSRR